MLDQTSFAIHPGNTMQDQPEVFHNIGAVDHYHVEKGELICQCHGGKVTLSPYGEGTLRVRFEKEMGVFKTEAVIQEIKGEITLENEGDTFIHASFPGGFIHIDTSPFRITIKNKSEKTIVDEGERGLAYSSKGKMLLSKRSEPKDVYYGLGEKTGYLDKRGASYTMWNTDVYAPHNPETDALYQSIPFFTVHAKERSYGIFVDHPGKSHIHLPENENRYEVITEGGTLDYYIFTGPGLTDVLKQYTILTGRMPMPPKWAIGYHQSRFSYENAEEALKVVETFREKEIPLDALYLDIHYMNGYRVFTFDQERFPDPEGFVAELKSKGVHVVSIVDPGVKADPEYRVFTSGIKTGRFCSYLDGTIYYGDVWPGESAFPDFLNASNRSWWGKLHAYYTNIGIEGIWNDMNEPAVFNDTKTMDEQVTHRLNDETEVTHRQAHNLYGFMMGKATYEGMVDQLGGKRTFLLTRSGYAGVQRYATVWTGDNRSFWEHLQLSLPMVMNLGLSGVAFSGPDVGGFAHDTNGELLARWTQVGAFIPYFRNHSSIDTIRQEPWLFGEEVEKITRKYIQLRYKWLPELYKWFREAHDTGLPVMRPLVLNFPSDDKTFNTYDQFMIGDSVMIAPVMQPDQNHRVVYIPEGKWIDYWSGDVISGPGYELVHADLDTLPVYIRSGYGIAQGSVKNSTKEAEEDFQVHLYTAAVYTEETIRYTVYDDDGETFDYETDRFRRKAITTVINHLDKTVKVTVKNEGSYQPDWETSWSLVIHSPGKDLSDCSFTLNERPQNPEQLNEDEVKLVIEDA